MKILPDTPQRIAVVIELNKSGSWSLGSYRVNAAGRRDRRSLGVFEDYAAAAAALDVVWRDMRDMKAKKT